MIIARGFSRGKTSHKIYSFSHRMGEGGRRPDEGMRHSFQSVIVRARPALSVKFSADAFEAVGIDVHQLVRFEQRFDLRPNAGEQGVVRRWKTEFLFYARPHLSSSPPGEEIAAG